MIRGLQQLGLADVFRQFGNPDPLPQRHLPAGRRRDRRVLRDQAVGPDRRGGLPGLPRAGDQRAVAQGRPQHRNRRQGGLPQGRRVSGRGDAARARRLHRGFGAEGHRPAAGLGGHRRPRQDQGDRGRDAGPAGPQTASRILHRLSRTPGVQRDQAWSSARKTSARFTSRPISAATPSPRCRPSGSATR